MNIKLIIIFFCLILSIASNGQSKKIKGRIISQKTKKPLLGCNISLLKSKTNTESNKNGDFTIQYNNTFKTDSIIISHIGYKTIKLKISLSSQPHLIQLIQSSSNLKEVIVNTGYQTLPKERATGSFTQLDGKAINYNVSSNILDRLDGIASGLLFPKQQLQNGPKNGFVIRGFSTINGPKDPLIIVDNFPLKGNIENINPENIKSITILKDAAATSIWGARAGNGVVVITTKSGKQNQPLLIKIKTSFTVTEEPSLSRLNIISSSEYLDVEKNLFSNGYYDNYLSNKNNYPAVSPVIEILNKAKNGIISESRANNLVRSYRDINFIDQYTENMYIKEKILRNSISFQGGGNKTSYFFSMGYDGGIDALSATNKRISLLSNTSYKPIKNVEISSNIQLTKTISNTGKPNYTSFRMGQWAIPYTQLADNNGHPLPVIKNYRQAFIDTVGNGKLLDWNYYPLTDWSHNRIKNSEMNILTNFGIKYQTKRGISASILYQYERQNVSSNNTSDLESYNTRDLINRFSQIDSQGKVTYPIPKGAILSINNTILESQSVRGQINIDKFINKSSINAILGGEIRQTHTANNSYSQYGYDPNTLTYSNIDYVNPYPSIINGSYQTIPNFSSLSESLNRFVSIYLNGSYTYDNRYIISISARRDASNLFGVTTNNKWNPLWSTGISWNLSNEDFYSSELLPFIKFRATYGISGNTDPNRTGVLTLRSFNGSYPSFLPISLINQFPNPELEWEKSKMLNIGIDFELKGNILDGSIEIYRKIGQKLYGPFPFDYTAGLNGYGSITRNVADMRGKGIDITINTKIIDKALKWNSQILFGYNSNITTNYYMNELYSSASYITDGTVISPMIGEPLYNVIGYKWGGLDPETGAPQGFVRNKISKDYYSITQKTPLKELVYKNAIPNYFGNIINIFKIKGFEINFNIAYKLGYYFSKPSLSYTALYRNGAVNGTKEYSNRWQKKGDEKFTNVPALNYPADNLSDNFYKNSSVNIIRGDNIRVKYVNLIYNLNKTNRLIKRIQVKDIQLYLNIANLGILWKASHENIDPDYVRSPIPGRSYTIGILANF